MISLSSPSWTRSGATPRTRTTPRSVIRGSPRAGGISPRNDVTAAHSKVRSGARRSDGSRGQEELSSSQGVGARHRHLWPRGKQRPEGFPRGSLPCPSSVPTVPPVTPRSTSASRGSLTPRKIMWAVMVSAFSGPGNEGTIRTTRERGVIRGMTCPHVFRIL